MPFIAKDINSGERVNILDYSDPRAELQRGALVCPFCGQAMIIKAGRLVIRHFAHQVSCSSSLARQPESPEHLAAKQHLWSYLKDAYGKYTGCQVELEVVIPEAGRIADIAVSFPMGWIEVHEIQLSGITVEDLEARTNDYLRAGCDVLWWLGGKARTPANIRWCGDNIGGVGSVDFRADDLHGVNLFPAAIHVAA